MFFLSLLNFKIQLNSIHDFDEEIIGKLVYSNSKEAIIRDTINSSDYEKLDLKNFDVNNPMKFPNGDVLQHYNLTELGIYDKN